MLLERMLSVGGLRFGEISPIRLTVATLFRLSWCDNAVCDISAPPAALTVPKLVARIPQYQPPLKLVRLKEEDINLAGNNVMISENNIDGG